MDRVNLALDYFYNGYNCSQSVFLAYCDVFGIDKKTGAAISSGFGGGMGGLREKCGAVTGMFMLAGLSENGYDVKDPKSKKKLYDKIKKINKEFEEKFGTSNCYELLNKAKVLVSEHPSERNCEYYKKRPCALFVETAAKIVEKHLLEEKIKNDIV